MSEKILYFAFGSNMHTARLQGRVPSAKPLRRAYLPGRRLAFRKRGVDGSAKCDAMWTQNASDQLPGVLFEIDESDLLALDRAEGAGIPGASHYERVCVVVTREDDTQVEAVTYQAEDGAIEQGLYPTSTYHGYVLKGAIEHGLPEWHVEVIRKVPHSPFHD